MMTMQFLLSIYLVYAYSDFAAQGPYEETNIFKAEMVIVLFFQITVMILERYVARTQTVVSVQKELEVNNMMKFDETQLFYNPKEKKNEYEYTVGIVV